MADGFVNTISKGYIALVCGVDSFQLVILAMYRRWHVSFNDNPNLSCKAFASAYIASRSRSVRDWFQSEFNSRDLK